MRRFFGDLRAEFRYFLRFSCPHGAKVAFLASVLAGLGAWLTLGSGQHDAEHALISLAGHGVGIGGKLITAAVAFAVASLMDRLLFGSHTILDVTLARKGIEETGEDIVRAAVIRARVTLYSAVVLGMMIGSSF